MLLKQKGGTTRWLPIQTLSNKQQHVRYIFKLKKIYFGFDINTGAFFHLIFKMLIL